jgi:hypothetical protein
MTPLRTISVVIGSGVAESDAGFVAGETARASIVRS